MNTDAAALAQRMVSQQKGAHQAASLSACRPSQFSQHANVRRSKYVVRLSIKCSETRENNMVFLVQMCRRGEYRVCDACVHRIDNIILKLISMHFPIHFVSVRDRRTQ